MKNNIRVERARVRMSQQELADKAGVIRQTIAAIEQGRFNPTGNNTVIMQKVIQYLWLLIVWMMVSSGCRETMPQKVDCPYYGFRNRDSQEIESIERTDTATVFHMKSFYVPDWWIRVAKETYLTDGKRRFALLSANGIIPGEKLIMGPDGQAEYTLYFEPIPAKTRFIHFIEGKNSDGAFKFR